MSQDLYLGIDFGTSGCRATVIDEEAQTRAEASQPLPAAQERDGRIEQDPELWIAGLEALIEQLREQVDLSRVRRLAFDGTSGTVLLTDASGKALTAALFYNDTSSREALEKIRRHCPRPDHITLGSSSALAKAVQLFERDLAGEPEGGIRVLSQADFLASHLCGPLPGSDWHNCLKLGYDLKKLQWPEWIRELLPAEILPEVFPPGKLLAPIRADRARQYGFAPDLDLVAGSTDANAAFIASGASRPGDAVTSLGSTLVIKILNPWPIEDLGSGVYSHRLGDLWLVGGASNAGAAILRDHFTARQIEILSRDIDPMQDSGLDYYPLQRPGERFPVHDPELQPRLEPRPADDSAFLHGLLEGLSRIEKAGYERLVELGCVPPKRILSSGGGAVNETWRRMRERLIGSPVGKSEHSEASYGSALLALGRSSASQPG